MITVPKAGGTQDFLSQYGALLGLGIGGLLPMLFNRSNNTQSQSPAPTAVAPPPVPPPFSGAQPGGMGVENTSPNAVQSPAPAQPQPNPLQNIINALGGNASAAGGSGVGAAGGIQGLANLFNASGSGSAGVGVGAFGSGSRTTAPGGQTQFQPGGVQFAPVSYAGTGPNNALLQSAGINPLLAMLRARLAMADPQHTTALPGLTGV